MYKIIIIMIIAIINISCIPAAIIGTGGTAMKIARDNRTIGKIIDDASLATSIRKSLIKIDKELFARINVNAKHGRILLTGNIYDDDARAKAIDVAWSKEGVIEVIDEMKINDITFRDYAKDSIITSYVKSKAILNNKINSSNYIIHTLNRVIYLFGDADNREELDELLTIASKAPNALKVISHMRIKDKNKKESDIYLYE